MHSHTVSATPFVPLPTLGQHAAAALQQCKTVRHVWCRNPSTEIDLRHSQPGQLRLLAIFGSWLAAAVSQFPLLSLSVSLSLSAVAIYLQIFFSIKNMYAPLAPSRPCSPSHAVAIVQQLLVFIPLLVPFFLSPFPSYVFWLFPFLPELKFGFSPAAKLYYAYATLQEFS